MKMRAVRKRKQIDELSSKVMIIINSLNLMGEIFGGTTHSKREKSQKKGHEWIERVPKAETNEARKRLFCT